MSTVITKIAIIHIVIIIAKQRGKVVWLEDAGSRPQVRAFTCGAPCGTGFPNNMNINNMNNKNKNKKITRIRIGILTIITTQAFHPLPYRSLCSVH